MKDLTKNEMKEVNGGRRPFSILRLVGFLDGIRGNAEVYLFGIRIY